MEEKKPRLEIVNLYGSIINNYVQWITILIAGIWIASVWFYSNVYIPSTSNPHVSINVDSRALEPTNDVVPIELTITLENHSDVRAYIAADAYHTHGFNVQMRDKNIPNEKEFGQRIENILRDENKNKSASSFKRNIITRNRTWLEFGRLLLHHQFLEKKEKVEFQIITHAPDRYDHIQFSYFISFTRSEGNYVPEWIYDDETNRIQRTSGVDNGSMSSSEVTVHLR